MRAVGGDEVQFDPASRLRQPGLDHFRMMVSGIIQSAFGQCELTRPNAVQKNMDRPDARKRLVRPAAPMDLTPVGSSDQAALR
jgi:hypothetical protein